ncbi:MAG TPA: GAF domain-containing SpoIIE family protein phosphatase [Gemmatimonadales bacterium]|nr:GAF domain-containing SpoIIE family protein phosphatase [Gemmatimonadales bacterium]
MSDAPGGLTRVEQLRLALEQMCGARLRIWREEAGAVRVVAGGAPAWTAWTEGTRDGGRLETADGPAWFDRVPGVERVWLETKATDGDRPGLAVRRAAAEAVGTLLMAEQETAQVAAELSERYEEIDLIYSISEILGHTIQLDQAAQRIVTEVASVVGARRATLLVLDEERRVLRLVAARGMDPTEVEPLELDDPCSVAARAFSERRIISYDPIESTAPSPGCPAGREYRGKAFLSVPIMYGASGGSPRPIGVINLTDRTGEDRFRSSDRKLVGAIANQIGAAIENSRLVARDVGQQRVQHELKLARDLQLKLLPSPLVIADRADVAARCRQAESVGGDFYNLMKLPDGRMGVMIGDVTSHGFSAALIMALVMAAVGIRAQAVESPGEALAGLNSSLTEELSRTEMFLTAFYAIIDPRRGRLTHANAGHPHAFVVDALSAAVTRLEATRPPLGVSETGDATDRSRPWRPKEDLLCLFTDGLVEAVSESGERFGEARVLGHVQALRKRPTREILDAIFAELAAFTGGAAATDDRTLVLLRA